MDSLDLTQSLIMGLSKLILTPVLKNGGFDNFFEDLVKSHNIMAGIGAGASDYVSQYFLEPSMFSKLGNYSDISLGQSALTGAIYTAGDWLLEEAGLYKGSRAYKYAWFPMEYNYLTEFIYITLLDSAAQVATPSSLLSKVKMANNKGARVYISPVQNGIPTQAPVQSSVLKKDPSNIHHKSSTVLKA